VGFKSIHGKGKPNYRIELSIQDYHKHGMFSLRIRDYLPNFSISKYKKKIENELIGVLLYYDRTTHPGMYLAKVIECARLLKSDRKCS
jgi:hypothetical protein